LPDGQELFPRRVVHVVEVILQFLRRFADEAFVLAVLGLSPGCRRTATPDAINLTESLIRHPSAEIGRTPRRDRLQPAPRSVHFRTEIGPLPHRVRSLTPAAKTLNGTQAIETHIGNSSPNNSSTIPLSHGGGPPEAVQTRFRRRLTSPPRIGPVEPSTLIIDAAIRMDAFLQNRSRSSPH